MRKKHTEEKVSGYIRHRVSIPKKIFMKEAELFRRGNNTRKQSYTTLKTMRRNCYLARQEIKLSKVIDLFSRSCGKK